MMSSVAYALRPALAFKLDQRIGCARGTKTNALPYCLRAPGTSIKICTMCSQPAVGDGIECSDAYVHKRPRRLAGSICTP